MDLIATRLFRFISIKKNFSSKDFEEKWRVRLARTFEFFKSPLDNIMGAVLKSQSSLVTCDLSTKNKKIRQKTQT
jgi:hypothetical protein